MQIALAAFAFLDVWLNQIAGFARLLVAIVTLGKFGLDKFRPRILDHFFVKTSDERTEQIAIADNKTRIQNGGADCHIFARKTNAFVDIAGGMADFQPHVPQHIEHIFGDLLTPRRLLIGKQKQQIDVRTGRKSTTTIAANSHNRHVLGFRRIKHRIGFGAGKFKQ